MNATSEKQVLEAAINRIWPFFIMQRENSNSVAGVAGATRSFRCLQALNMTEAGEAVSGLLQVRHRL